MLEFINLTYGNLITVNGQARISTMTQSNKQVYEKLYIEAQEVI